MNILISLGLRCLSLLISTTLSYLTIVGFLDKLGQTNTFLPEAAEITVSVLLVCSSTEPFQGHYANQMKGTHWRTTAP